MGTGWRRAFCSSIPRDRENAIADKHACSSNTSPPSPSPSPRSCSKLGGFFSSASNPSTPRLHSQTSTPRLRCRTTVASDPVPSSVQESPRLQCKTTLTPAAATTTTKSPRIFQGSNQSSPRSPLGFSLLKTSLRLSRSSCGVCLQSVKTGQGTAIFTAECSHAFHFPCIAAHVRKNGCLVCPVCSTSWREVPLLAIHKNGPPLEPNHKEHTRGVPKEEKKGEKEISSPRDIHTKQDQKSKPSDPRSYDDDEPLLSPTAGARFIPIPEADENGEEPLEDEIEEFQGFFPSSIRTTTSSSNDASTASGRDARNVDVRLLPEAAVVSAGRSHETYVVALKIKAPPAPAFSNTAAPLLDPSRRAPIDLVTVLDVSGSMTGAKLQMLKRSMRLVISSLGSGDRLSIVAFSASSKRLLPLRRMTAQGQRSARRIIDRLVCGQGTSVGEALRKATKVLEDRRERNPVASIMLLSDGQDERVSTTAATNRRCPTSHVSSTRFAHLEIPVHTFGFGEGGSQQQAHQSSKEPTQDAFAKCVGGLLSVVVQDLRLQIGFSSGSSPAEITAIYSCGGRPTLLGSGNVRIGDLYAEEEREVIVEMRVPANAIGAHHVMSVRCSYKDPAASQTQTQTQTQTQEVMYEREQCLLVPRPHAIRSSAPKIERLREQYVTTKALAEAKRLVEQNELSSALQLLASARALLIQSSSIPAEEYVRWLETEMVELQRRRQQQHQDQHQHLHQVQRRRVEREVPAAYLDENGEPLTPTSAWRAAERLAKVAIMRKSLNRVSDLHGFENARF